MPQYALLLWIPPKLEKGVVVWGPDNKMHYTCFAGHHVASPTPAWDWQRKRWWCSMKGWLDESKRALLPYVPYGATVASGRPWNIRFGPLPVNDRK